MEKIKMSTLEEFNKGVTIISHGGIHDFNEAILRTPEGFVFTKMSRSLDYYHWNVEYTKIEEWKKNGGECIELYGENTYKKL